MDIEHITGVLGEVQRLFSYICKNACLLNFHKLFFFIGTLGMSNRFRFCSLFLFFSTNISFLKLNKILTVLSVGI